uniref:BTB domain-containing protein n=2 Tax=Oryza brachyantha TaxID=4533 RepID=J3MUJ4_ORYBR
MPSSSGFAELKIDHPGSTNGFAIGDGFNKRVCDGEHELLIRCYPRGCKVHDDGEYVSLRIVLVARSSHVKDAIACAFLQPAGGGGPPPICCTEKALPVRESGRVYAYGAAFRRFVRRSDLEPRYVVDGAVTVVCGVVTFDGHGECDRSIRVPQTSLGSQLAAMVNRADCSDVRFSVGGEMFYAHRAVLAARSPVFGAELLGSMAESTMACITLDDVEPTTFRALLEFVYTDELPARPAGLSSTEFHKRLLAAADRYDLDRLKLMCAQKLWESVSVETAAATLGYAEMYSCPELKKKCIEFLMTGNNLNKVAVTDDYFHLREDFPLVIKEIKTQIGSLPSSPVVYERAAKRSKIQ